MDIAAPTPQQMASLLLSAAHGDADAHWTLGQIYAHPLYPQQDPIRAQHHLQWAALLDSNH